MQFWCQPEKHLIVLPLSNAWLNLVEIETVDTALMAAQFCREFESFDKIGRSASSRGEARLHPQTHLARGKVAQHAVLRGGYRFEDHLPGLL